MKRIVPLLLRRSGGLVMTCLCIIWCVRSLHLVVWCRAAGESAVLRVLLRYIIPHATAYAAAGLWLFWLFGDALSSLFLCKAARGLSRLRQVS